MREIEDTRSKLEHDIRDLEDRLPEPAVWTKRLAGVAVGGGVSGTAFWFVVRRVRKRRRARNPEAFAASHGKVPKQRMRTLFSIASFAIHVIELREIKKLSATRTPYAGTNGSR